MTCLSNSFFSNIHLLIEHILMHYEILCYYECQGRIQRDVAKTWERKAEWNLKIRMIKVAKITRGGGGGPLF